MRYLHPEVFVVLPKPGEARLEPEVDPLELVDPPVPAFRHSGHLGLVHLKEGWVPYEQVLELK